VKAVREQIPLGVAVMATGSASFIYIPETGGKGIPWPPRVLVVVQAVDLASSSRAFVFLLDHSNRLQTTEFHGIWSSLRKRP